MLLCFAGWASTATPLSANAGSRVERGLQGSRGGPGSSWDIALCRGQSSGAQGAAAGRMGLPGSQVVLPFLASSAGPWPWGTSLPLFQGSWAVVPKLLGVAVWWTKPVVWDPATPAFSWCDLGCPAVSYGLSDLTSLTPNPVCSLGQRVRQSQTGHSPSFCRCPKVLEG